MKVRISGFQLTFHAKTSIGNLCKELVKKNGSKFTFTLQKRILRVQDDTHYLYGTLLTDRGHKNFVAIDTTTDDLTRGTLGANRNFGAFNFFMLCKKTNTALMTSYREAGGPTLVFGVLDQIGCADLLQKQAAELQKAGPGASKKVKNFIVASHEPPSFHWIETLGRVEYAAALAKWTKIRAIEVEYDMQGEGSAFIPFDDHALDKGKLRMSFKRGTTVSRAVEAVKSILGIKSADEAESIRVEGNDQFGLSRRVIIEETIPTLFGELDHDAIVADGTSFHKDLKSSFVIQHLRSVAKDYPTFFG